MGYYDDTEDITIVVALLLFLYKSDDSRVFYRNIFLIIQYYKERGRMNLRLLSVRGI